MSSHIRIRPTALVIKDNRVLMIEYKESGNPFVHYNLPGGGAEPGESITETLEREMREEVCAEIEIGPLAFVYEYAPHKQSGDYTSPTPSLNLIFECSIKEGSIPRLPEQPDPNQVGVKWIPLNELRNIILYPNIKEPIIRYANLNENSRTATLFIEDHQLPSYSGTPPVPTTREG